MPNPLIAQGFVNLTRASISIPNNPALNITPSFLGKAGIRITLEGQATQYSGTMTGAVKIPQVYLMVRVMVGLLKTQALSEAYKTAMETNSDLGAIIVRPDISISSGLQPYDFTDGAIVSVSDLNFAGENPDYPLVLGGVYQINSNLWNI